MPSPNGVVRSLASMCASVPRGPLSDPAARVHLGRGRTLLTVNVVVLAGTVAADPVTRRMPSGDEVTEVSCRGHDGTHARGRHLSAAFRGSSGGGAGFTG